MCTILFSVLFAVKTIELVAKNDPELNMVEHESNFEGVNLYDLGFMLAIESFDSRIGKISMEYREWDTKGNKSKEAIPLVDCA